MLAKELMRRDVFTVRDDTGVGDLIDLMVRERIHGCPVIDGNGKLVGVVTQQDVFFSGLSGRNRMTVRELMTSPAVSADEETEILSLCRMMHRLGIHRVPIVKDGKVTGIISSLDIVGELAAREETSES
jgi:CBS domain-containing protein